MKRAIKIFCVIIPLAIALTVTIGMGIEAAKQQGMEARPVVYKVTAYCVCEKCCGKYADGITASGAKAEGKLIAAPKDIPFHTWINVPGYGWAEVLDRGGCIKGRRLDLLFPTHQEALEWGVQYLEVRI